MNFIETKLKGAYIIESIPIKDERGEFFRTYCKKDFEKIGSIKEFVQNNQSINNKKGTLRGLHYQIPFPGDCKLVRCINGRVLDIIVDLREGSETFLNHIMVELSSDNHKMIFIPERFAHGFITLEDNSKLIYQHTSYYDPEKEAGLLFNDPRLNIELPEEPVTISERDLSFSPITTNFKGI